MKRLVVGLLLLACGCARYNEPRMFSDSVRTVPNVVQKTAAEARDALDGEGFLVRLQERTTNDSADVERCPDAKVVDSDPAAGQKVVKATTVTIVVARCG